MRLSGDKGILQARHRRLGTFSDRYNVSSSSDHECEVVTLPQQKQVRRCGKCMWWVRAHAKNLQEHVVLSVIM